VPQWPQADCIFTAPAFEVAAVLFRDEVERFITWVYQRALDRSNPSSPAHSEELTVQVQPSLLKDLEEATLQLQGEVTMVKPTGKRKAISPVQAMSVPLPISRTTSNQPSLKDSPIPLSPIVLTPPSARSLELPAIRVSPHNLGRPEEEVPPAQERTTILLQRQVADSRTPLSSPESTMQRLGVPNLDIPNTPFRPLSAAESFSPPSASTPRVLSRHVMPGFLPDPGPGRRIRHENGGPKSAPEPGAPDSDFPRIRLQPVDPRYPGTGNSSQIADE
jgi:hypothetical protein